MNKELEEARKYLEHEVKVYENNKEINQLIGGKSGEIQHKLNITLLKYIENSISKEVIKEKKQELEKEYKEYLEENSTKAFILKCQLELINEMLEGK